MISPAANTIVVFSDIGCPWAHACVWGLHEARLRLGLEDRLSFDMRAFPLELHNERPTPRDVLAAEVPVLAGCVPEAGWRLWSRTEGLWPVTMLPALEAVAAAKAQSLAVSDRLDRALRSAFFGEARCISMLHEILSVARAIDDLDGKALEEALVAGSHRADVFTDFEASRSDEISGSPHVFLPDGNSVHNPGIEMSWPEGSAAPRIERYDRAVYDALVRSAVA